MDDTISEPGSWARELAARGQKPVEYISPERTLLDEADKLILWAIRPSGSGEPVPVMLERCRQWRMRWAEVKGAS